MSIELHPIIKNYVVDSDPVIQTYIMDKELLYHHQLDNVIDVLKEIIYNGINTTTVQSIRELYLSRNKRDSIIYQGKPRQEWGIELGSGVKMISMRIDLSNHPVNGLRKCFIDILYNAILINSDPIIEIAEDMNHVIEKINPERCGVSDPDGVVKIVRSIIDNVTNTVEQDYISRQFAHFLEFTTKLEEQQPDQ